MKIRIITGKRRSGLTTKYLNEAKASGRRHVIITEDVLPGREEIPLDLGNLRGYELVVIDGAQRMSDDVLRECLGAALVGDVAEVWILTHPPTKGTALWDLAQRHQVEVHEGPRLSDANLIRSLVDATSPATAKGASLDAWAAVCSTIRRKDGESDESLRQRLNDAARLCGRKVLGFRIELRIEGRTCYFVTYEGQGEREVRQEEYEAAQRQVAERTGCEGIKRAYVYPSGSLGVVTVRIGDYLLSTSVASGGQCRSLTPHPRPSAPDDRCTCRAKIAAHQGKVQAHHKTCPQWSEVDSDWCVAQGQDIKSDVLVNRSCWLQAAEARDRARAACKRIREELTEELAEVREELAKTQKAADEAKMARDRLDTESDALRCENNRLRSLIDRMRALAEAGTPTEAAAHRERGA